MRLQFLSCLVVALGACPLAHAQAVFSSSVPAASSGTPAGSAPALPDAPQLSAGAGAPARLIEMPAPSTRAFRSVAFQAKVGTGGIGLDIATPLNRFLNLRAGAQLFDDTISIDTDGIQANGDITLQNVYASLDIFPFRHSSFHLSPGITLHNDNHIAGPFNVPGGQSFSLGEQDYTSDPAHPINGFGRLRFGNTVAPRFTIGFGNMLPRSGSRFSVPFEIGVQYTSAPTLDLELTGNGCTSDGCGPINAGAGPGNLQSEIQMLQSDLSGLRIFPIASIGVSCKFGH